MIRERTHLRYRQRRIQGPNEVADRRRQRQRIAGGPYHEVRHAGGRALPRDVHRARPRRVEPLVLHVGHDGDDRRIFAPDLEGREVPRHRPADRVCVRTVDEPRRGLAQDHRGHRRKEVGGLEPAPLPQRRAQGREVAGRDRAERQGDGAGTRIRAVLRGDETDLQGRIGGGQHAAHSGGLHARQRPDPFQQRVHERRCAAPLDERRVGEQQPRGQRPLRLETAFFVQKPFHGPGEQTRAGQQHDRQGDLAGHQPRPRRPAGP